MMPRHPIADLSGQRFGRLTAVKLTWDEKQARNAWLCACDCGAERTVVISALLRGNTKSCGCLRRDIGRTKNVKHGMYGTPIYVLWRGMRDRTVAPESSPRFKKYSGRGIRVCERWKSFENFYADMGPRPSPDHSLDRIDNNGDYEPGNCRWATTTQQNRNKRSNHKLTLDGETLCLSEWAERLGMSSFAIRRRLASGWPLELALTAPPQTRRSTS